MSLAQQGKYQDAITVFNEVEQDGGRQSRVKAAHLWASFSHSKMQPQKPPATPATDASAAPAAH
jgi:hypothetical protein